MVLRSLADSGLTPKEVRPGLWAFPPVKGSNNCQAWWLGCLPEPVLIDCPPVTEENILLLEKLSSKRLTRVILTNRESHGQIRKLQFCLDWPVLIQEQEAYLLPKLNSLGTFKEEHITASGMRLLWTPGPTPGSCVVYAPQPWNVLFCGRLLIPRKIDELVSLRNKKTFHWTRQQKSLDKLRQWIPSESRPELASGVRAGRLGDTQIFPWLAWK